MELFDWLAYAGRNARENAQIGAATTESQDIPLILHQTVIALQNGRVKMPEHFTCDIRR